MEELGNEESLSIQRRVLSELEKAGEKGISYEDLRNKLTKNVGAWDMEILLIYESVMLGLENSGYISEIQNDASNNFENKNGIVYHLTSDGYKLIEFYKKSR